MARIGGGVGGRVRGGADRYCVLVVASEASQNVCIYTHPQVFPYVNICFCIKPNMSSYLCLQLW